jgi:hypothetical protein
MYHDLPRTARLWSFLFAVDRDLAKKTRTNACPCGGRLHSANYLRKPRGTPARLPEAQCIRLSFCCDRDGCRKRLTPPSVRFLGPKVYLGIIVILISAMRQGPSPRRVDCAARRSAGATRAGRPGRPHVWWLARSPLSTSARRFRSPSLEGERNGATARARCSRETENRLPSSDHHRLS